MEDLAVRRQLSPRNCYAYSFACLFVEGTAETVLLSSGVASPSRRAMVVNSLGRASGRVQGHSAMQMPQDADSAK